MELRFKVPGIPDNTIYFYWHTDAADYMGKNMVVIALKEKVRDIHMIRKSSSPKAVYWINNNEVKAIEESIVMKYIPTMNGL
jgi:hydroxymethylglutaryl-CoA reductase